MYGEGDGTIHDAVHGLRGERTYGEVQLIGDAVDHIAQQVVSVNCQNLDADGIEHGRTFLVVNGHDGVALL